MTLRGPARLGAAILAAGSSRRMGSPKALLLLDSKPLIQHLTANFQSAGCIDQIAVVTGANADAIKSALSGQAVSFHHNAAHAAGGMLSSVKIATGALANRVDAIFIALLDQPLVRPATITLLATRWKESRAAIALPSYNGKRGHPIVIDTSRTVEILSLREPATLRDFVAQHLSDAEVVPVADSGVVTTLDTPADFERLKELWRSQSCQTEQG